MPYSLARSGTLIPAAYRARISALRSAFLGVLGDIEVEEGGEPGYRRFTSAETASSKVKIKLPSALKACGSICPIGAYGPGHYNIWWMRWATGWCSCISATSCPWCRSRTTRQVSTNETARYGHGVSKVRPWSNLRKRLVFHSSAFRRFCAASVSDMGSCDERNFDP